MGVIVLSAVLLFLAFLGFTLGRSRAAALSGKQGQPLHSRFPYYGLYVALFCGLPAAALMVAWALAENQILHHLLEGRVRALYPDLTSAQLSLVIHDVQALVSGGILAKAVNEQILEAAEGIIRFKQNSFYLMSTFVLVFALLGLAFSLKRIQPNLRARIKVERFVILVMVISSTVAILTTFGIVISLLFESLLFFKKVPWPEFLFGLHWSPQTALRTDQVGSSGSFGAIPLFAGTLLITVIAMAVAVPVGIFAAIYMSEYADKRFRSVAKPVLEVLAGIPTVVYGFFAALTVAPFFRDVGTNLGLSVSSESALAAGTVMGIMIIPFVSSLSDDVMNSVPQSLRDGSHGLGATQSETIRQVIFPAALPGIVGAVLLAVSRAIGETMIVMMAAGLAANLTVNPLEAVTTVTVQIVTLLVGDQEFDSAKTLAAFALGLMLYFATLFLNVIALRVVRKYREKYD